MENKNCKSENCKRPYRAKGYCRVHYKKWRRGDLPHTRYNTCLQDACRKQSFQKSLCEEHFKAKYGKKDAEQAA